MNEISMSLASGRGSIEHNMRDKSYANNKNIDWSKSENNIVLINDDIKKVYNELFNAALEEYNAKQKRKDRKINDYYEHEKNKMIKAKNQKTKNKTATHYELIVQLGNKDEQLELDKTVEIYKDFLYEFINRNSNMRVFSATIHLDESTPHLHIDYIPWSTKTIDKNTGELKAYQKGLKKQVALNNSIAEMGYLNWLEWKQNNDRMLEKVALRYDVKRKIMFNTDKHLDINTYKDLVKNSENELNIKLIEPKINKLNENRKLKLPGKIELQEPAKTLFNNVTLSDYNADISKLTTYIGKLKKAYNEHITAITNDFNTVNKANIERITTLTHTLNTARKDNILIKKENERLQNAFLNIKNKNDYLLTKDYIIENQELKNTNDELIRAKDNDDNQIKLLENQVKELENSNNAKYKLGYNKGYYNAIDELISDENTYNELKELNAFIEEKDKYLDKVDNIFINKSEDLDDLDDDFINKYFINKSEEDIKTDLDLLVDTINDKYDNIPSNNLFDTIKERLANLSAKVVNCLNAIINLLYDKQIQQNQETRNRSNRSKYDDWER